MAKEKFNLENYKKTIKVSDTPLKKDMFIKLDECMQEVLGMEGFPYGHIIQIFGKSDTSKTSLLFDAAAKCQAQGGMAVLIITEGKVDWSRAAAMGFKKEDAIVEENIEYLEDAFDFIDKITMDVSSGNLPYNTMIFWDSIGNTLSREEVEIREDGTTEKKSTMMKAAKIITEKMRVISRKINDTRKVTYPKAVGLIIINQAYTSPASFPGGMPALTPYGGSAIYYRATLVLRTSKVKKLIAKKNGKDLNFAMLAKISVDKNHLTNVAHSGEFVVTADSIIPNEPVAIAKYKEDHKSDWDNNLEIIEVDE